MTFGSLFAGIGGMDLGLERAGMECKWQVEIDDYARRVLAKHWPGVRRWDDIRTFQPDGNWKVDLIAGGFPCQDISVAGPGVGLEGTRSGLWFEFLRILRLLRPRYAIIENVAALTYRGLGTVLSGLAELGFDAEWSLLPACTMGAPHARERLFIIAYRDKERWVWPRQYSHEGDELSAGHWNGKATPSSPQWGHVQRWISSTFQDGDWESPETSIHRMVDGIPPWLDRNGLLGNSVVPQVAEWIGMRIMELEG